MKTLVIDGKEFKLKNSFGVIMEFEKLSKKKASNMDDSISDIVTLCYATLHYNNPVEFIYTFDQFISIIDNDNAIIQNFTSYLLELQKEQLAAFEEEIKKKMEELSPVKKVKKVN